MADEATNSFGRITIVEEACASPTGYDSALPFVCHRYTWHPTHDLATELPSNYQLSMDCWTDSRGQRFFTPRDSAFAFSVIASLGGLEIIDKVQNLDAEGRFGYQAMRLIHQLGPRLQEHFGRDFTREEDFYLTRANSFGDAHLLPCDLGMDQNGNGIRWNPAELIRQGLAAARQTGIAEPTRGTCIRYGLLAAARRNPVEPSALDPEQTSGLIRLALFDLGPADVPTPPELIEEAVARLLDAMKRHIADDTETFNRWFFDHIDNIVHQIAKKKKLGGPLPRETVRQVILETVFRSYRHLSNCIHAQMYNFHRSLPQPLDPDERATFDLLYQRQPFLGELPLILLHDRYPFLLGWLREAWHCSAEQRQIGVLLRLLQFYGEMASRRREADRRAKQNKGSKMVTGQTACHELNTAAQESISSVHGQSLRDQFQDIVELVRAKNNLTCRCGTTRHWYFEVLTKDSIDGSVIWREDCEICGHSEMCRLTAAEFEDARQKLQD